MNAAPTEFRRVPIQPVDCLKGAGGLMGDQYWLFVGICFVGILIGSSAPFGLLLGPMMCGIFLCYLGRERGYWATFELLFRGFDYFAESLIATMIMVGVILAVIAPLYILILAGFLVLVIGRVGRGPNPEAAMWIFAMMGTCYLLMLVLSLLVQVFFFFTYPLIVDRRLKAIPAIKASLRASKANFGGVLGLVLLNALIGLLAALCCCVPVLFVLPICLGSQVVAYRKVFPAIPPTPPEVPVATVSPEI